MVHSRWFDSVKSEEEEIGREGMVTMLNELARYALVKKISVFIVDEEHLPVGKAKVCFEIINYSEYTPIAAGLTDEKGTIELTTGLGSLHIFVKKGTLVGEGFMDTRKENSIIVTLKEDLAEEKWKTWDMFAPADSPVNRAALSKEQAELGRQKLSLAVEKRKAKMADFKHP